MATGSVAAPRMPHLRNSRVIDDDHPVRVLRVVTTGNWPLLHMHPAAYASIAATAPAAHDGRETGGVLLGHEVDGDTPGVAGRIEVRRAGDPGPNAVRTPTRFVRDAHHAQRLADLAYAADRSVWIGEWHTHPGGQTSPSPTDLGSYITLLDDVALRLERFVTVIVVASPEQGWHAPVLAPWLVTSSEVRPMLLNVVTPEALRRP